MRTRQSRRCSNVCCEIFSELLEVMTKRLAVSCLTVSITVPKVTEGALLLNLEVSGVPKVSDAADWLNGVSQKGVETFFSA